jgi:hypothetical protein
MKDFEASGENFFIILFWSVIFVFLKSGKPIMHDTGTMEEGMHDTVR